MIRDTKRRTADRLALARARRRRGSAGVSANLLPWIFAGGLPVISFLSYGLGDTLGGGNPIVITGTNVNGATAVSFGGAAATITGNTDTTVTVTLPPAAGGANAFGVVNVTVTTPRGTSNALPWEYWAPHAEPPGEGTSHFAERIVSPNQLNGYSISGGTGTWVARGGGTFASEATTEPTDAGGYPSFNGSQRLLTSSTIGTIGHMADGAEKLTCAFVIKPNNSAAPGSVPTDDDGVLSDAGRGGFALAYTNSGFTMYAFTTVGNQATQGAAVGAWHSVVGVLESNVNVRVAVNGNNFTTTSMANYNQDTAQFLNVGVNWNNTNGFIGEIRAVALYNVAANQTFVTKFHTWANQRHIF